MGFLQPLLFNDAGRLRSGWRLGVFLAVFLVLLLLISGGVRVIYALVMLVAPQVALHEHLQDLVFRLILLSSALGAGYICARVLEGLPWRSLGLTMEMA